MDGDPSSLLYSDYTSGIVRRLFPTANDEFEMGPSFGIQSPAPVGHPCGDGAPTDGILERKSDNHARLS
jgi:hypothetical protein